MWLYTQKDENKYDFDYYEKNYYKNTGKVKKEALDNVLLFEYNTTLIWQLSCMFGQLDS